VKRQLIFFLAIAAFCQNHSPDTERIFLFKNQAASLLADIPNYSCLESMDESVITTTGRLVDIDLLRVEVAVSGSSEMYAWPNSRNFSDRALASILGNSFNTAGIFSNLARRLLGTDFAQIKYLGQETIGEEPVLRYAFHLPADSAPWRVASVSQNGIDIGKAGEDGEFWVNSKGLILRRIEVSATGIPRNLRLKNLHMIVDYQRVSIGDRRVLLPSSAIVRSSLRSDLDRESYIVFNHCRAFAAESALSFGEPQLSAPKEKLKLPSGLPEGLNIPIALLLPISASTADGSDVLKAVVSETVRHRSSDIIRKGAEIEGHVFRHRADGAFEIEIDRVNTVNGWMPIYARLRSIDAPAVISRQEDYLKPNIPTRFPTTDIPTPGVAIIKLTSASEIPAGTAMVWITEGLTPRINFVQNPQTCPMCFAPPPFQ
jgi:hypothetical protein